MMNTIREIQNLNKRELENGVSSDASWHADYRDTAYIYIGGLSFDLTEGDVIAIFSQFGEPTYVNLIRDKETGKSKGFAFLKYEDQRSTDLAVDNLGGATVLGRVLKIDHTRYKQKDDEVLKDNTDDFRAKENVNGTPKGADSEKRRTGKDESNEEGARQVLKEEKELQTLIRDHDEDDPMKGYLIQEKKEEVAEALARLKDRSRKSSGNKKGHHHRHRSRKDDEDEDRGEDRYRRSRHHKHR